MLWILLIPVFLYSLTILVIGIALASSVKSQQSFEPATSVSVVIACHNEEHNLPAIIDSLFSQIYPRQLYELIFVDDNSSDNTAGILSGYAGKPNFRILKNKGAGKKSALKCGIESSDAELIITTDADCRMGKNWISSIVSFYKETDSGLIIGPVIIEGNTGFFSKFQELEFLSIQGITEGTSALKNPVMCNGANLAFKREAFIKHARNLNEEIASGDDVFLLHSIKRDKEYGIMFLESEDAVVATSPSVNVSEFLKQRSRWLSKARYYRDRFTICLGIVTFFTIASLLFLLAAGISNTSFFSLFGAAMVIKSIPDFLILYLATRKRGKTFLLKWFIPSQIIYPFYVAAVSCAALLRKERW